MTSNIGTINKRAAKKSSRNDIVHKREICVRWKKIEDSDIDKDVSSDMEVSSDSEDSDWVDEEHILNEVEVDMKDFYEYTDKDVEWTGCNKGNTEIPIEDFVPESVDLDDFHSASESDTELEGRRKKALRKLRKEHEQGKVVDNTKPFYVGRNFPDKETVIKVVLLKLVAIKKSIVLWKKCTKTDLITAVCRRNVNKLTDEFLVKEIEETIKPNPEVPIRALKDQLQKKYQLGVSDSTILQISSAILHISNIDYMYIKSYSFRLFSSLPGVLTPVRGESLKILNGFDVSLPVSHLLWSSQSFGHQKAINGFDMPLPVAVCSGLVNPLAPSKGKFHGGLMTMSTLCT
ncbi:hypothetical protein Tco_1123202 [Tanacetum coccineum]|uniref:Uncharacterized protein n=1 Tax=Tanacetum coccineum TaxID=301880 RepID=A0ABQ5J2Q0_9ASTR